MTSLWSAAIHRRFCAVNHVPQINGRARTSVLLYALPNKTVILSEAKALNHSILSRPVPSSRLFSIFQFLLSVPFQGAH